MVSGRGVVPGNRAPSGVFYCDRWLFLQSAIGRRAMMLLRWNRAYLVGVGVVAACGGDRGGGGGPRSPRAAVVVWAAVPSPPPLWVARRVRQLCPRHGARRLRGPRAEHHERERRGDD